MTLAALAGCQLGHLTAFELSARPCETYLAFHLGVQRDRCRNMPTATLNLHISGALHYESLRVVSREPLCACSGESST